MMALLIASVCRPCPVTIYGLGASDNAAKRDAFVVTWCNEHDGILIPADQCEVTSAIEQRFGVTLHLVGGPLGSEAYNALWLALLRGAPLPDVFPWQITLNPAYPGLSSMYAALDMDVVRKTMPRTIDGVRRLAERMGTDEDELWRTASSGGRVYAIPRPARDWRYPQGVLWRKDILDEIGKRVPRTIEEWEDVLRAYTEMYPDRHAWAGMWGAGFSYPLVFRATGLVLDKYVERNGKLANGSVQPEMKQALATLQQWYRVGYITLVDQGSPGYATDTMQLFVQGKIIVTDGVPAEGGNWVCEDPYVSGSIEDRCRARNPEARFALGRAAVEH